MRGGVLPGAHGGSHPPFSRCVPLRSRGSPFPSKQVRENRRPGDLLSATGLLHRICGMSVRINDQVQKETLLSERGSELCADSVIPVRIRTRESAKRSPPLVPLSGGATAFGPGLGYLEAEPNSKAPRSSEAPTTGRGAPPRGARNWCIDLRRAARVAPWQMFYQASVSSLPPQQLSVLRGGPEIPLCPPRRAPRARFPARKTSRSGAAGVLSGHDSGEIPLHFCLARWLPSPLTPESTACCRPGWGSLH